MKKRVNYFSHDSNARNDEKMLAVRMKYGAEGYGIFFMIVEKLREETDYSLSANYEAIAFELHVTAEKVKSIIEDFGLFEIESGRFCSASLDSRMEIKDQVSKSRSETGKKGAANRWEREKIEHDGKIIAIAIDQDNKTVANVIHEDGKNIASKVKESKVKEINTNVPFEQKLLERFSPENPPDSPETNFSDPPTLRKSTREILLMQDLKLLTIRHSQSMEQIMDNLEYFARVHAKTAMKDREIQQEFERFLIGKSAKVSRQQKEEMSLDQKHLEYQKTKKIYVPNF